MAEQAVHCIHMGTLPREKGAQLFSRVHLCVTPWIVPAIFLSKHFWGRVLGVAISCRDLPTPGTGLGLLHAGGLFLLPGTVGLCHRGMMHAA